MLEGCTPWPAEFSKRYIRDGLWEAKSLADALREAATAFPDRIFLTDQADKFSYRDVDLLSDRLALRLVDRGLLPRDIVLLQLPNTWEFFVVFFALHKIGVIPVMCLPSHRQAELTYFAELTRARGYFFAPRYRGFDYLAMAREVQAAVPSMQYLLATGDGTETGVSYLRSWMEEPLNRGSLADYHPEPPDPRDPFDVAFFLLSGGTTGIPKLIPRTHADYIYHSRQGARVLGWSESTVFLVVLPAAHNFPLGAPGMVGALSVGGSVAMCPSTDPDSVFQAIQAAKATILAVSPALLIMLLNSPRRDDYDLSSLRFIYAGGQKMQPELADRTWSTWKFAIPTQVFGMAEGLINVTHPEDSREVIRETQGRPISPADEIKIVDDGGQEVPPGAVGELITRGPYTIRGYYRAEEHNRAAFTPDGFYRTGDMVRLHPSGNLVVEGRKKDLINRGGEKISAEEIENLILCHENVHMAAVVAMPDPVMGERGCAFVIPRPGCTLTIEQLTSFLMAKKIAKFKLPERLEMVDSFPLTSVGKISKKDLREQIAAKLKTEGKL
jgi:2,3-dihydroxybenzoate---[aryl-carrier protein] ligase